MPVRRQVHADNLAPQKPAMAFYAALRRLCRTAREATHNWLAVAPSKPAHTRGKAILA